MNNIILKEKAGSRNKFVKKGPSSLNTSRLNSQQLSKNAFDLNNKPQESALLPDRKNQ